MSSMFLTTKEALVCCNKYHVWAAKNSADTFDTLGKNLLSICPMSFNVPNVSGEMMNESLRSV